MQIDTIPNIPDAYRPPISNSTSPLYKEYSIDSSRLKSPRTSRNISSSPPNTALSSSPPNTTSSISSSSSSSPPHLSSSPPGSALVTSPPSPQAAVLNDSPFVTSLNKNETKLNHHKSKADEENENQGDLMNESAVKKASSILDVQESQTKELASPDENNTKPMPQSPSESRGSTAVENQDEDETDVDNDDSGSVYSPTLLKPDSSSDLLFKKKDVRRARTQSFQSVLSTASLKSMRHNSAVPMTSASRNASISGTNTNGLHNGPNPLLVSVKDFQSFIQAPVLLTASNFKPPAHDTEIGQQLPFNETRADIRGVSKKSGAKVLAQSLNLQKPESNDAYDDQDTIIQQQLLTLNALKKLSLSPMPIINVDESIKVSSRNSNPQNVRKSDGPEPYQPAQVDLSSFASLTRQPKVVVPETITLASLPSTRAPVKSRSPERGADRDKYRERLSNRASQFSDTGNTLQVGLGPAARSDDNDTSGDATDKDRRPLTANNSLARFPASQLHTSPRSQLANTQSIVPNHPNLTSSSSSSSSAYTRPSPQRPPPPVIQRPHDMLRRKNSNLSAPLHKPMQPQQLHPQKSVGYPKGLDANKHSISALASATTLTASHPTRPKEPLNLAKHGSDVRQIKGLRTPMYVPAVLRVTNPTDQIHGGGDKMGNSGIVVGHDGDDMGLKSAVVPPGSETDLSGSDLDLSRRSDMSLSRSPSRTRARSTQHIRPPRPIIARTSSQLWSPDEHRMAPTRRHWLRDEVALQCGIQSCNRVFSFFERRHHCRKCGGIFCGEHTSHYLYINHQAQFTTGGRGTLSRVCNNCISEYNAFMQREFGSDEGKVVLSFDELEPPQTALTVRADEEEHVSIQSEPLTQAEIPQASADSVELDKPESSVTIGGTASKQVGKGNREGRPRGDLMVGSVPANWTWSSF